MAATTAAEKKNLEIVIPGADELTAVTPNSTTANDDFDPASLVLTQDFEATSGTKLLTTVPVSQARPPVVVSRPSGRNLAPANRGPRT